LKEPNVHILLENDTQDLCGLIKNETDFDLTRAKLSLQVNAHTGLNRKTWFYFVGRKAASGFSSYFLAFTEQLVGRKNW